MNSDPKLKKFRMFMSGDHLELTRVNKIVINGLELLIQDGLINLESRFDILIFIEDILMVTFIDEVTEI